jgi:O-antigen/teichoic acid export membrane protein
MVLIGVAGIYSTLLLLGSEAVVPVVLGPRYSGMRPIVGAWCAVVLSMLLRDGASVLLQTMKQFRTLAMSNALSAAVSIGCVVWFMNAFGIPGAVAGSAAGDLVLAALLWRAVRRERATIG